MSTLSRPVVSVVMPFFNAERWIGEALQSLSAQQFAGLEVIAIDDGSSDRGAQKVEQARHRGLNVHLLRQQSNQGIVRCLNLGLDAARGHYIARMDADDICMPQRLSRQLAFLEATGCDLCGSWFREFGQGLSRDVRWPHGEAALRTSLMFQNTICHPTVMAHRRVFEHFRYRESFQLAEDYDLFARAAAEFRVANVPEVLLRYRRHAGQSTQARRQAMEAVTQRIRADVLRSQGVNASTEELRLHNLVRAPSSITSAPDLLGIEHWLQRLASVQSTPEARAIVASQWVRAAIRAAPLGGEMWRIYRNSSLRNLANLSLGGNIDLAVLAILRLDYGSRVFHMLRRLGISA